MHLEVVWEQNFSILVYFNEFKDPFEYNAFKNCDELVGENGTIFGSTVVGRVQLLPIIILLESSSSRILFQSCGGGGCRRRPQFCLSN